ncbi:MAG: hypothetical protein K0Q95_2946 [Bacteroidota bacterium]|jgi:hypothetical protein|nr:hypothetical protein [Bacteroidota bacterium]
MEDDYNEIKPVQSQKRPVSLSILCIMTFISSGFSLIGCMIIPFASDLMIMLVKQSPDLEPQAIDDAIMVLSAGGKYYLLMFIVTALSFTGAILMWNLKKNGFHFYTIANILIFYIPIMWLGLPFNAVGGLFALMFVGFYALHLKYMH